MTKTGKVSGAALFRNLKRMVDITVATVEDRDSIKTYRRRWGMVVAVFDDGDDTGLYVLEKKNNDISDNSNWRRLQTDVGGFTSTKLSIATDGQTLFTVPAIEGETYAILNGVQYTDPDYTIEGTTLTWADDELETDDELVLYYQL